MDPDKYSLDFKPRGHSLWFEMAILLAAIGLSAVLFFYFPALPLSVFPLMFVGAWMILPRLGARSDQAIFLSFLVLCFLIDDTALGPWGTAENWSEMMGILLFQSFGILGMEAFALGFAALCVLITTQEERRHWLKLRLTTLLIISLSLFLPSLLASAWGALTGGALETIFIQIRFLYLLPVWAFIGFVLLRDRAYFHKFLFWFVMINCFKAAQTIFMWATHRELYRDAEYIYEHYAPAFLVVAMLYFVVYAFRHEEIIKKILNLAGLVICGAAYLLNDRRTSYVGIALALAFLLCVLPKSFMRVYGRTMIATILVSGLVTAATWNLPGPLGFVGALYRSFGAESGTEGPSYRDLENANLFREIARSPITGLGFGKEFNEFFPMPSVAANYPRYKMIPHNTLLFTWTFGGPLAISGLSVLCLTMLGLAGRMIYDPDLVGYRFIGVVCLFYFVQYFSYVFGDIGLQINRVLMMVGLLMGGCYRLIMQRKEELGKC